MNVLVFTLGIFVTTDICDVLINTLHLKSLLFKVSLVNLTFCVQLRFYFLRLLIITIKKKLYLIK